MLRRGFVMLLCATSCVFSFVAPTTKVAVDMPSRRTDAAAPRLKYDAPLSSWASLRGGGGGRRLWIPRSLFASKPSHGRRRMSSVLTMSSSSSSYPLVLIATSSDTGTLSLCHELASQEATAAAAATTSGRTTEELASALVSLGDGESLVMAADEYLSLEAVASSSAAAADAVAWLQRQKLAVLVNDGRAYAADGSSSSSSSSSDNDALSCSSSESLAALRRATAYELAVGEDEDGGEGPAVRAALKRMVDIVTGFTPATAEARRAAVALEMGPDTFFLSTTCKDVAKGLVPHLALIEESVDVIELRADLLARPGDARFVLRQIAALRAATDMPILFTVRSASQCGTFADDPKAIAELAAVGLRGGVEWLDVEACWGSSEALAEDRQQEEEEEVGHENELLGEDLGGLVAVAAERYPSTRLLGSTHVVGRRTGREEAAELFRRCSLGGRADGAKVVLTAFSEADTIDVVRAKEDAALDCPAVAICLGDAGKISRVLNRPFTPVCHEALGAAAAPGQMSASAIMEERRRLFLAPKRFFLLGTPIGKSPSPDMHNAAFRRIGLPWEYGLCDTRDVRDFTEGPNAPLLASDFGGASVTIPHKQAIIPYLDEVTPAALAVGAVNTVVPVPNLSSDASDARPFRLLGDNTDWLGIVRPLSRAMKSSPSPPSSSSSSASSSAVPFGLVVGAGGTARAAVYALRHGLGLPVVLYSRSPDKAKALAEELSSIFRDDGSGGGGGSGVASADDLSEEVVLAAAATAAADSSSSSSSSSSPSQVPFSLAAVVSTVPAAAEFALPEWVVQSSPASSAEKEEQEHRHRPAVLDVVYKPPLTALVQQAREAGLAVVPGATMLVEQGLEQSETWTKRRAPRKQLFRAVLANILKDYAPEDEERAEVEELFRSLPDWEAVTEPAAAATTTTTTTTTTTAKTGGGEGSEDRSERKEIVVLFGPPAAGKGTHGPRLEKALGVPTLSTGDMLRQAVAEETAIGLKAREVMAAGRLVSDEIVVGIIKERTSKEDCKNGFILDGFPRTVEQAKCLDAILASSSSSSSSSSPSSCPSRVTKVLALEVPDSVLEERICGRWVHKGSGRSYHVANKPPKSLKRGQEPSPETMRDDDTGEALMQRADDTKGALADRLAAYHAQTVPILAHYEQRAGGGGGGSGRKGVVVRANAHQSMENVWADIARAMDLPKDKD